MKLYRVQITWHHRKWGPQAWRENVKASNQWTAAYRSVRLFYAGLRDGKERRDANRAMDLSLTFVAPAHGEEQ